MTSADRVAIVTGGSSGIGLATARMLLEAGWSVTICARDATRLEEAVSDLRASGTVEGVVADVASADAAADVVASTAARFGGVDGLVNAHGVIGSFETIEELDAAGWNDVLSVNLMGPIHMTKAALPHLRERRGSVVNVSSINCLQAEPQMAPYGVAKAGLVAFTKYAACELAADGVRVNAVAPGWVRTPMGEPFFAEAGVVGKTWETNMLGRAGEPEELASVITFLLGPGASFVTGETLVADGGHSVLMAPLRAREESPTGGGS
jgi:NAD(P)-dependent dehydrogenase (short-subunit alcohol dehydrogenase family)